MQLVLIITGIAYTATLVVGLVTLIRSKIRCVKCRYKSYCDKGALWLTGQAGCIADYQMTKEDRELLHKKILELD